MNNKQKRNLFFALTMTFSLAIPILVVMIRYNMFSAFLQASTKIKLSIIGCIIIFIILAVNLKRIKEYLSNPEFSVFKCIINGIVKIVPLACMILILVNMQKLIDDLTFIVSWILGCNFISLFIFEPLWQYYRNECKIDKEYKKWHEREIGNEKNKI